MPRCQSCGEPIVFGVTQHGRLMPLNAIPSPAGTIVLDADERVRVVGPDPTDLRLRYVSHFATCPAAAQWRGRSR
jgi:hypothetical protein